MFISKDISGTRKINRYHIKYSTLRKRYWPIFDHILLHFNAINSVSDKIISGGKLPFNPELGGLGKTFFTRMKSYGDVVAQIDGYTGETDTYSGLLQRCVLTAIHMRSKGISKGDIISICSYNHFNCCVPFISALFIGAVSANLDPSLSISDTIRLIKIVRPKIIFVGPEVIQHIESSLQECEFNSEIVVFGKSDKYIQFSKFIEPSADEESFTPVEVELKSTAVICFSSGTSGFPKGVCVTHMGILCQAIRCKLIGYNLEGFLGFSSLYWFTAIYILSSCIMHKGYKVVVPTFDINTIWDVLSKVKVSAMLLSGYFATIMCQKGRPNGVRTSLQCFGVNGYYVSAKFAEELQNLIPEAQFVSGYGLTEECGYCICFKPNSPTDLNLFKKKPASAGLVLSGFSLKVVDLDTEEPLGPFQKGELRIKSDIEMNGYYNLDSLDAWDHEKWLQTGDIVYYDDDKCFYIVDRIKELIRVKSDTVIPAVVEEVVKSYPGIEAAVVVGMPHPTDSEHPVAIVVLQPDAINKTSPEDIIKYVEDRVDDSKRLRGGVKIVSSIPITPTGKFNRRRIKDMVIQQII